MATSRTTVTQQALTCDVLRSDRFMFDFSQPHTDLIRLWKDQFVMYELHAAVKHARDNPCGNPWCGFAMTIDGNCNVWREICTAGNAEPTTIEGAILGDSDAYVPKVRCHSVACCR